MKILRGILSVIFLVLGGYLIWSGNQYSWVYKDDSQGGMLFWLLGLIILFFAWFLFPFPQKRDNLDHNHF